MNVHCSLSSGIFQFLSFKDAVCVCPKVPIGFIQVDGHRKAQVSAQFCSVQLKFSHFGIDKLAFDHFCRFFHYTVSAASPICSDFQTFCPDWLHFGHFLCFGGIAASQLSLRIFPIYF